MAYARCLGLQVRIARYHNIFGPEGTWTGGREKAPAALCRKIAVAEDGDSLEIWGDGRQTRSFLYVSECIEGTVRLIMKLAHASRFKWLELRSSAPPSCPPCRSFPVIRR
jgi:nucleoside-diphosphate-sugar epimerase